MPVAREMGDVGGGMEDMFASLPFATKYWFSSAVVVTLAGNFGAVGGVRSLIWSWDSLKDNFEIWRLVTPFCWIAGFSFDLLIYLHLLWTYSSKFERGGAFNTGAGGGTADYVFCLLFGMVGLILTYPVVGALLPVMPAFGVNLIFYVLYLWSKQYPTAEVMIWFFPVKGQFLPFAYIAFDVLVGKGSYPRMLHGMAVAHIYYFLVAVVPVAYGKDVLHTPQFLIDTFGIGAYQPTPTPTRQTPYQGAGGPGRANPPRDPAATDQQPPQTGDHQWGSGGIRLGRD